VTRDMKPSTDRAKDGNAAAHLPHFVGGLGEQHRLRLAGIVDQDIDLAEALHDARMGAPRRWPSIGHGKHGDVPLRAGAGDGPFSSTSGRRASSATSATKAVVETLPHYLGIYNGKASEPHVCEAIETSDCLLSIGYRPIEMTTGDFTASLPANTIRARGHSVDVSDDNYQAVTLKEVLRGIVGPARQEPCSTPGRGSGGELARRRLRQADSACLLAGHPGLPPAWRRPVRRQWHLIRSLGSEAPAELHLHRVSQLRVDRLLGRSLARCTDRSAGINNGGYTIERGDLGKTETKNDIANWPYANLPKVFCPDTSARSFVVKTSGDLQNALSAPNDTMIFVESIMDPNDAPAAVTTCSNKGGRPQLRASRPATPRKPAAPAGQIGL
jgi:hypothetical protein